MKKIISKKAMPAKKGATKMAAKPAMPMMKKGGKSTPVKKYQLGARVMTPQPQLPSQSYPDMDYYDRVKKELGVPNIPQKRRKSPQPSYRFDPSQIKRKPYNPDPGFLIKTPPGRNMDPGFIINVPDARNTDPGFLIKGENFKKGGKATMKKTRKCC